MSPFPAADPIPLPAPVWLFKFLHDLTFVAHLAAVDLLLGGLILGVLFSVLGRMRGDPGAIQTAGIIAHRLPAVMSFVINLGVPPLLFAQVLYGRALYTSSVLIGAYWIAVIFLLMASYYGLYHSAQRVSERRSWTAPGLAVLVLVLTIAFIYSNNMTLMLRPQVWAGMYQSSPAGVQWNGSDPALWPRWAFFICGSLPVTGAALMILGQRRDLDGDVRRFLVRSGGLAAATGIVLQSVCLPMVLAAQPGNTVSVVMGHAWYGPVGYLWCASALVAAMAGAAAAWRPEAGMTSAIAGMLMAVVNAAAAVVFRDGIRDVTLRAAGFEVWDRQVVTNWSVVVIFLVLLVMALGAIGYLLRVMSKARRIEENYA